MADLVSLGECMLLLCPADPIPLASASTLQVDIAGAESNCCIALSRLGHRARFISRVGDDPAGRRIRQTLQDEGVDTTYLTVDPEAATGVFFREWLPDGARRVYYYRSGSAASRLSPADLPAAAFAGARVVHLTGITPALSTGCAQAVAHAIALAHAAGARVSFDPNYRPRLWDPETARAALLPLIRQVDLLLMGDEDARALLGSGDEDELLGRAAGLGVPVVVMKCGDRGVRALAGGRAAAIPAHPVERVVDPVGAGDGFDAGFLAGWLEGLDLEGMLRLGAQVGAAAVTRFGDYAGYPRRPGAPG